jgi:hypothetical protein
MKNIIVHIDNNLSNKKGPELIEPLPEGSFDPYVDFCFATGGILKIEPQPP